MADLRKSLRVVTITLGIVLAILITLRITLKQLKENRIAQAQQAFGEVGDFNFTERSGKNLSKADLKGKFWVADFIFTRCMGPCPLITTKMAMLQSEFKDKPNLTFVSFTVDPKFDTPSVLSKYADSYGASKDKWFFLGGKQEDIYNFILTSFHLVAEQENPTVMDITHSTHFVLVSPEGKIMGYFNSTDTNDVDKLREKLKGLPSK